MKDFFIRKAPFEALSHSALFSSRFSRLRTSECHREASLVTNVTGLGEIEKMRQPHQEFENSRSKCEKAAPNPADYLGEIPLDYRDGQHKCYSISTTVKVNNKAGTGTRVALGVVQLPKGTFWTETTVTDMPHKAVPGLGHKHSGIILGGTRDYEGVTGSFDLELSKDGKYTVTVCHIVRDKK